MSNRNSLLFGNDWEIIERSLQVVTSIFNQLNLVEIGVHEGGTTERIINWLSSYNYHYYGIDPNANNLSFKNFSPIKKHSYPIPEDIPKKLHWIFIDGCHCENCVYNDLISYTNRLVPYGLVLLHDAAPSTQGTDPQNYPFMVGRHDEDIAAKGIAVKKVLDSLINEKLILLNTVQDQERGGIQVLQLTP